MGGNKRDGNLNDTPELKIVTFEKAPIENETQSTFLISWGTRKRDEAAIVKRLLVLGLGSVSFDHIDATLTVKHSSNADIAKIRHAIEASGAEIVERKSEIRL